MKAKYLSALVLGLALIGSPSQADTVSQSQQLVDKWLGIERQNAALQSDWIEQQASLKQSLQLLEEERAKLQSLTEQSKQNGSALAQKRSKLTAEQNQLEREQAEIGSNLEQLVTALKSIELQLPPPLKEAFAAAGDLTQSELGNSEILQMVLDKLAKLNDFQSRITTHQMALQHPDGSSIWVKQVYLGASQAWFVSDDLRHVGLGFVTPEGWQWRFDSQAPAQAILDTYAMLNRQKQANWVTLPVLSYSQSPFGRNTQTAETAQ